MEERDLLTFCHGGDEQIGEADRAHVPAAPQCALDIEGAMPVLVMDGEPLVAFFAVASNSGPLQVAQPTSNSMTPQVASSPASISGPETAATAGLLILASALTSARWLARADTRRA
jgi:hypothetical protein